MIRKRAMVMLGMALLVAVSGAAVRAQTGDDVQTLGVEATVYDPQTAATNQDAAQCLEDGGFIDQASGTCEIEAP